MSFGPEFVVKIKWEREYTAFSTVLDEELILNQLFAFLKANLNMKDFYNTLKKGIV